MAEEIKKNMNAYVVYKDVSSVEKVSVVIVVVSGSVGAIRLL